MPNSDSDRSDTDLALWMLDRMADSEAFLAVIQAARVAGRRDVLDAPDYVARHKLRLKKLYQSGEEEDVDVPASLAGTIEALVKRDMLSGPEELLEKALAAYVARHPRGIEGLPAPFQSTIEAARAEIEGRTSGNFAAGFTATLAAAARDELAKQKNASRSKDRGGREA